VKERCDSETAFFMPSRRVLGQSDCPHCHATYYATKFTVNQSQDFQTTVTVTAVVYVD